MNRPLRTPAKATKRTFSARPKATQHPRKARPKPATPRLFAFNKPMNVLSQFTAEAGVITLANFIEIANIYPAGRLDKDSEGLLLLTNDGALQAKIASPKHKMKKTYFVLVEGEPSAQALQALAAGIVLKDGPTLPAEVAVVAEPEWLWPRNPPVRIRKHITDTWLRITIQEGRNRQVRRMTAHIGHPTLRLIRWQIGPYTLANLAPGSSREIAL